MDAESKLALLFNELSGLLNASPELKPIFDRKVEALVGAIPVIPKPLSQVPQGKAWSDLDFRSGRNPAQFIRDEYKDELSAGTLTRARLRMLDRPLYFAYANWITPKRHPDDDLGLPTGVRTNLAELSDPVAHVRKQRRESAIRWRQRSQRS